MDILLRFVVSMSQILWDKVTHSETSDTNKQLLSNVWDKFELITVVLLQPWPLILSPHMLRLAVDRQ